MSEQAARSWLSSHHDIIPALEIYHRQALETLENHTRTVRDLADIVALDPGMSVSLYHEVNSGRGQSGKHPVDSVHTALGLLGDSKIADLIMQHKVLERTEADAARRQSYHQLMSRTLHLLAQLDYFSSFQGIRAINEIRSAGLLHNIGEFCACLFDHERYRKYEENFHANGSDVNSARAIFGFDFHELGRVYAEKSYLPELVTESLDENVPAGRKARLIQLAADVSHQAEAGWYHSAMKATEEVCAEFLNQSQTGFDKRLQQVAIEAARQLPFRDVMPAAARLIMLPDSGRTAKPPPKLEPEPEAVDFEKRVRALLQTQRPTQAQVLDLLLRHLHDDIHLSRVALLLLSPDGSKLGARAGKGIDQHSPIRTLVINLDKASLIKSILDKPQALWVETDNYRKYEAALPEKFKAAFLHESFFLMSMHVGKRPVGLVYSDRFNAVNPLDKLSYVKFKSAILLASKALAYLGKLKPKNPA